MIFFASCASGMASQLLSEEPRIEYVEEFLTQDEVRSLRRLSKTLDWDPSQETTHESNGGEEFVYLNASNLMDEGMPEDWEVVSDFAQRAASWAHLPLGDAVPVVTRWEPWTSSSHLNRSGSLHLDPHRRLGHRKTVLVYLSGHETKATSSLAHGFTVFPCIETDDMEADEVARRLKLCSQAHRHLKLAHEKLLDVHAEGLRLPPSKQLAFLEAHPELATLPKLVNGTRPMDWSWTWMHDAVAQQGPGASRLGSLKQLVESMCHGEAMGLRVAPRKGAALLFESARPRRKSQDTVPEWRLWHAGCSPADGELRWTLQLFLRASPASVPKSKPQMQCAVDDERCS